MKIIGPQYVARSLVAIAMAVAGGSALAAWNLNILGTCGSTATTETCNTTGTLVATTTLSGWSTGSGLGSTATTAGTTFAAAAIQNYGNPYGTGIVATNESASASGPHAFDNVYGIDAMLLNFGPNKVNLSSLTIGWNGTDCNSANVGSNGTLCGGTAPLPYSDSDLSVLAWTGSAAPTVKDVVLGTAANNGLLAAGWALVGNYADVGSKSGNSQNPVSSAYYSSYWLISAYSTSYGTTSSNGGSLDGGNDAFKILSVAGDTCSGTVTGTTCSSRVSEPGSLALVAGALVGMVAIRRRKGQVA